jgi:hypothetical protein
VPALGCAHDEPVEFGDNLDLAGKREFGGRPRAKSSMVSSRSDFGGRLLCLLTVGSL